MFASRLVAQGACEVAFNKRLEAMLRSSFSEIVTSKPGKHVSFNYAQTAEVEI